MSRLIAKNIKLLVCDMAGTIVNENGIIYKTMRNTLNNMGFNVRDDQMRGWYGKDKKEVLRKHISYHVYGNIEPFVNQAEQKLIKDLETLYFEDNNVSLIHYDLFNFFEKLRSNDVKIALNTGYPSKFQEKLISHLNMEEYIDSYISSDKVKYGRPYPYMIYRLAENFKLTSTDCIAKIGDTIPDMLEGINADCGLTIGTLTGVEDKENLSKYSDFVVNNIMDLDDL